MSKLEMADATITKTISIEEHLQICINMLAIIVGSQQKLMNEGFDRSICLGYQTKIIHQMVNESEPDSHIYALHSYKFFLIQRWCRSEYSKALSMRIISAARSIDMTFLPRHQQHKKLTCSPLHNEG
jgi:hypothetical protein